MPSLLLHHHVMICYMGPVSLALRPCHDPQRLCCLCLFIAVERVGNMVLCSAVLSGPCLSKKDGSAGPCAKSEFNMVLCPVVPAHAACFVKLYRAALLFPALQCVRCAVLMWFELVLHQVLHDFSGLPSHFQTTTAPM